MRTSTDSPRTPHSAGERVAARSTARRWTRRIALALACLAAMGIVAGTATEAVLQMRNVQRYPPRGRLVDLGGRRLQLDCRGTGSPTVVLESGLDHLGSLSWAVVHDSLASTTRVCAYSRAGMLWSDPAPGAFDATRAAHDLHAALLAGGESPPWVVVGHSLGGPYAMLFTSAYAAEVSGMVLVDASHPRQLAPFTEALGRPVFPPAQVLSAAAVVLPVLARIGVMRLSPDIVAPAWPDMVRVIARAYLPRSATALLAETRALQATFAQAARVPHLGTRPLVVLTAIDSPDSATAAQQGLTAEQARRVRAAGKVLQDDEATWSDDSRHELVPHSSHYIQFDRPDVVIRAVRDVVVRARRWQLGA